MRKTFHKTQIGRSMVEMLGVLAIIGVLSVGGIAGYNMAMEKHRLNQTIEIISLAISETQAIFANSDDYSGLGEAQTKDFMGDPAGGSGIAVEILEKVGASNSYYPIMLSDDNAGNGKRDFFINVLGLPMSSCIAIYSKNWENSGYNYGGIPSYIDGNTGDAVKSMSPAEAQKNCQFMYDNATYTFFGITFNPNR